MTGPARDPLDALLDDAQRWSPSEAETRAAVRSAVRVHEERVRARRRERVGGLIALAAAAAISIALVRGSDRAAPAPTTAPALSTPPTLSTLSTPPTPPTLSASPAPPAPPAPTPSKEIAIPRALQIGPAVAAAPTSASELIVERLRADVTEIQLRSGLSAFQLHHPDRVARRLVVRAGMVRVTAVGTVFAVDASSPERVRVFAIEGVVEVATASASFSLAAGAAWPAGTASPPELSALVRALDQHVLEPMSSSGGGEAAGPEAPPRARAPGRSVGRSPAQTAAESDAGLASSESRWQRARRLRAQGDPRGALTELTALAEAHDPTWSPIAEIEMMRIYEAVLADPAEVARLAQAFLSAHPNHPLEPEVRQVLCRAGRTLGRPFPGCR